MIGIQNIIFQRIDNLRRAYDTVEDIDLFIGAIQELPTEEDSLVGSTFLCLIGDVFARMRFGDRFFYDNENQAGSFTEGKKYSERSDILLAYFFRSIESNPENFASKDHL